MRPTVHTIKYMDRTGAIVHVVVPWPEGTDMIPMPSIHFVDSKTGDIRNFLYYPEEPI